jgi:hypothetical protein
MRVRVLVADLIVIASALLAIFSADGELGWRLILQIQFPLVFGAFWLYLARLQCPHCEVRLSEEFPTGALPLLPFSKQSCKVCRQSL